MGKRHNNLERKGLHRVALVIEDDFEWVFREQPIADVGIDALVEKCNDGEPTGQFLALQIKSGQGNVYERKNEYIYYISNVHYYYWTKLDIPIILLVYIPKKKKVFWGEINKSRITKTNKGWKLSIPFKNEFHKKSRREINEIILKGKGKMLRLEKGKSEAIFNIEHFNFMNESLEFMINYTSLYSENVKQSTSILEEITREEESDNRTFKIQVQKHNLITVFEALASRIYNEVHIFAIIYVKAILATKDNLLIRLIRKDFESVNEDLKHLDRMLNSFDTAIHGISSMKISIENLRKDDPFNIGESFGKAILALNKVILELDHSKRLSSELLDEVKNKIN